MAASRVGENTRIEGCGQLRPRSDLGHRGRDLPSGTSCTPIQFIGRALGSRPCFSLLLTHPTVLNHGRAGDPGVAGAFPPLSATIDNQVWLASDDGAIWLYRTGVGLQQIAKVTTSNQGAPGLAISGPLQVSHDDFREVPPEDSTQSAASRTAATKVGFAGETIGIRR
jgi:hypothetical protein